MKTREEIDAFWDLDRLLPKKKAPTLTRPAALPVTVTVTQDASASETQDRERETRLSIGREELPAEEAVYVPKSNPFLLSVTLSRPKTVYSFYGHFVRDAHRYFNEEGKEVPYTAFFSYIPQYSQLSEAQRAYYFFFRQAARRAKLVKTDFSYLMLLVYEILNLPDLVPPEEGIQHLTFLWKGYRKDFPQIDKYLAAWLPDYCLLHRLPCPNAALSPILSEVLAAADFKEFYLGDASELTEAGMEALIALASDYRYRYSRYAVGEMLPRFESAMHGALYPVISRLLSEENIGALATEKKKEHMAFTGSLCAHNLRCRLSVTYCPFAETPRFRTLLTQAVKYTENKLRAEMAVKSRLSVTGLPPVYKAMINRYFEENGAPRQKKAAPREEAAYLSRYEAESTGLSLAGAADIEEDSWEVTRLLVEEEAPTKSNKIEETVKNISIDKENTANFHLQPPTLEKTPDFLPSCRLITEYELSEAAVSFLRILCEKGYPAAFSWAKSENFSHFTLLEEINGAFFTHFGDIVLEENENGAISVIQDYLCDVKSLLQACS